MTKFVTLKELKEWRDTDQYQWPDDWPSRVFDTFVEMEKFLIIAEFPALGLHRNHAEDIKKLLEQIEPEDDS